MENASKALLMAAGILIAILVISMIVMMFNGINGVFSQNNEANRQEQITKFNLEYESYNRDDLRGNEMLSLLAKAQDYNTRKSDYEGANAGYQKIAIVAKIDKKILNGLLYSDKDGNKVFKKNQITQDDYTTIIKTKNECITNLTSYVKSNKNQVSLTENNLESLAKAISIICDSEDYQSNMTKEKKCAFLDGIFNQTGTHWKKDENPYKSWWSNNKSKIQENVKKYYEYAQFKKVYFKCTNTTYNENTGRIVKMEFEATGIGE